MPDSKSFTPEEVAKVRRACPHVFAVEEHEGLATSARNLEHQEVLVFGHGDAAEGAWQETREHPTRPELFDRACGLTIEHSERIIALEQARIAHVLQMQNVAREAVMRATQEDEQPPVPPGGHDRWLRALTLVPR